MAKRRLKPNTYKILEDVVEVGINGGYSRAFKYDDKPSDDHIRETILHYVMLSISENFIFDDFEQERITFKEYPNRITKVFNGKEKAKNYRKKVRQ